MDVELEIDHHELRQWENMAQGVFALLLLIGIETRFSRLLYIAVAADIIFSLYMVYIMVRQSMNRGDRGGVVGFMAVLILVLGIQSLREHGLTSGRIYSAGLHRSIFYPGYLALIACTGWLFNSYWTNKRRSMTLRQKYSTYKEYLKSSEKFPEEEPPLSFIEWQRFGQPISVG